MVSVNPFALILGSLLCLNIQPTTAADSIRMVGNHLLTHQLDSLQQNDPLATEASMGIEVYDLQADTVLYGFQPRKLFTPASNMKILVALAALNQWDAGSAFNTSLYYTGKIRRKVLQGNLYLQGGGDPELTTGVLDTLILALQQQGIRKVRGSIYADTSRISTPPWGKGWSWDDIPYKFLPRLSALMVNKGVLTSHSDSLIWSRHTPLDPVYAKTPEYARSLFTGLLANHHLKIRKEGVDFKRTPPQAILVSSHKKTLRGVLVPMMKNSDNLNAEMMLFALGQSGPSSVSTTEKGLERIRGMISQWGFPAEGVRLVDGSGLSFYNAVSPALLVEALKVAYRTPEQYALLKEAFPRAATDGTLKNRMTGTPAAGIVYAKTGTLTGACCLSGYVERADGRTLAFSIMIRGYAGSSAKAGGFQDKVAAILATP